MSQSQRIIFYILTLIAGAAWIVLSTVISGASTSGNIPAPQSGFAAPDFTLQTTDGQTYTLSALHGQAVLINVWIPW